MIIGLSGKAGTGKTTLAGHLLEKLPDSWSIINFGDLLKQECSLVFGFPLSLCYSEEGKNSKINGSQATVRDILQWYGTDIVRQQDPEHWVNLMIDLINNSTGNFIIADIRFPNEADMITDFKGLNVRIKQYEEYKNVNNHISETALDGCDIFQVIVRPKFGELPLCVERILEEIVL